MKYRAVPRYTLATLWWQLQKKSKWWPFWRPLTNTCRDGVPNLATAVSVIAQHIDEDEHTLTTIQEGLGITITKPGGQA